MNRIVKSKRMLFVTSDSFFLSKLTGLGQNTQQKGINFILTVKSLTKRTLSIIKNFRKHLESAPPRGPVQDHFQFWSPNLLHTLPPNASGNLPFSLSLEGKLAKPSGARDINLGNLTQIHTYLFLIWLKQRVIHSSSITCIITGRACRWHRGHKHTHVLCSQCHACFISPPPPRLQKCSPHARRLSAHTGYVECAGCAGLRGPRGVLSVNTGMLEAVQKSQWLAPAQSQPPLTSHTWPSSL